MAIKKSSSVGAALITMIMLLVPQALKANPMHRQASTEYEAMFIAQQIDAKCPSLDTLSRTAAKLVTADRWGYLVREGAMTSAQIATAEGRMKEAVAGATCAQLKSASNAQAALREAEFQRDLFLMIWGSFIATKETDAMMGDMLVSYSCGPFDQDAVISVRPLTGLAYGRLKTLPNFEAIRVRTKALADTIVQNCYAKDRISEESIEMLMLKAFVEEAARQAQTQ